MAIPYISAALAPYGYGLPLSVLDTPFIKFSVLVNPCPCFSYLRPFIFLTFFFNSLIFCSVFSTFCFASLFIFSILRFIFSLASFISIFYFIICSAIVLFFILYSIFFLANYFFSFFNCLAIVFASAFQSFSCFSVSVSFFLVSAPFLRFWLVFLGVKVFLAV